MASKCICECSAHDSTKAPWNALRADDRTSHTGVSSTTESTTPAPPIQSYLSHPDIHWTVPNLPLANPNCHGMSELPEASELRARVSHILQRRIQNTSMPVSSNLDPDSSSSFETTPLFAHLAHGLALTAGSALGSAPPSLRTCLTGYLVPNRVGLTAGARAWSKHAHRSASPAEETAETRARSDGWWGAARGPQAVQNDRALELFYKIVKNATWRNLHWLPHRVLVYEVRVAEGYGARWSQDQSGFDCEDTGEEQVVDAARPWMFRGFLEPTMENGHELKWRHPLET